MINIGVGQVQLNNEILAVCYARISTDEQSEKSIDAQIAETKKMAESLGATKIVSFHDIGISGKTDKRPEFQNAISYATTYHAKMFVVHKIDFLEIE